MTDRELLELAAKAAGWGTGPWVWSERAGGFIYRVNGDRVIWNPLTDDGDAMRLMVKLWLTTETCMTYAQAITPEGEIYRVFAEEIDDPLAATRRAIVRAAAEIGRQMP